MKQKTRAWIAAGLLIGGGLQTAVAESDGGRITLEERRQIQGNTPVYREVETKDLERAQLEAIARVFGVSDGDIRRFRWARLMLPPGHEDEGSVQYSIWRGGQQSRPEKVTIKIRPSGEVSSPRKRRVEEDERSNEGAGKRDRRDEITGIRQKKERPVGKSRLVAGAAPMFTVAADEFGDEDEGGADSGFGFALTGEYWLRPHLVLTGSIGYQRWNVNVDGEDEPAAFDANWSTTPVKAGIKVPFGIGPMQYFLKAESGMYRLKATAGTEELTISDYSHFH